MPCQQGCANTVDAGWFVDGCKCDSFSTFYPCNDTHCKVRDSEGNEKKGYCITNDDSLKNNSNYEWKESSCKFECKNGETQAKCEAKNPPGRWFPQSCECADPPTTCPPCPETQYRPELNCNNPCKCFDCLPEGKLQDPTGLDPACTCVCNPETACPDNKKLKANASYPTCECECKESCQSPLVQKSSDCSCDCPTGPFTVHRCTTGDGVVKCVECYEASGTYNATTCSCDCNEPCPSPKVRKAPDIGGGVTKNPTCLCYCPEGDVQCECGDELGSVLAFCGPNKKYTQDISSVSASNPKGCKCVCDQILSCGSGEYFDDLSCSCECESGKTRCVNECYDNCLWGQIRKPGTCNICSCEDENAKLCTPDEWPIGPSPKCVKCEPGFVTNGKCECVPTTTTSTTPQPNWYYQKCTYRELDCSEAWTCAQGPLEGGFSTEEECQEANPDAVPCPDPICTTDDDCGANEKCNEGCCEPVTTTTTSPPTTTTTTTSTTPPTTTTNGPTTTPTPCSGDEYCEPFCCVDGVCQECPQVEYRWYCIDC